MLIVISKPFTIHSFPHLRQTNFTYGISGIRRFVRLQIPELPGIAWESSLSRHKAIGKHLKPNSLERIKEILSDQSDPQYSIYRVGGKPDYCKTVAVGKSWTIGCGDICILSAAYFRDYHPNFILYT
jgi:hypothetical protein